MVYIKKKKNSTEHFLIINISIVKNCFISPWQQYIFDYLNVHAYGKNNLKPIYVFFKLRCSNILSIGITVVLQHKRRVKKYLCSTFYKYLYHPKINIFWFNFYDFRVIRYAGIPYRNILPTCIVLLTNASFSLYKLS